MPTAKPMTVFFDSLGAPFKNIRWSWGARRAKDGLIFLRAWNDDVRRDSDGKEWVRIGAKTDRGHGWVERREHIKAIEAGSPCFLVMCEPVDSTSVPREVHNFDDRTVRVAGEIQRDGSDVWIRVTGYKSIWEVR